jgi:hypothetical protein
MWTFFNNNAVLFYLIFLNTPHRKVVVGIRVRTIQTTSIRVEVLIAGATTPPIAVAAPIVPRAIAHVVVAGKSGACF